MEVHLPQNGTIGFNPQPYWEATFGLDHAFGVTTIWKSCVARPSLHPLQGGPRNRQPLNSVAFCSPAKILTFSGLRETPLVGKKIKFLHPSKMQQSKNECVAGSSPSGSGGSSSTMRRSNSGNFLLPKSASVGTLLWQLEGRATTSTCEGNRKFWMRSWKGLMFCCQVKSCRLWFGENAVVEASWEGGRGQKHGPLSDPDAAFCCLLKGIPKRDPYFDNSLMAQEIPRKQRKLQHVQPRPPFLTCAKGSWHKMPPPTHTRTMDKNGTSKGCSKRLILFGLRFSREGRFPLLALPWTAKEARAAYPGPVKESQRGSVTAGEVTNLLRDHLL